MIKVIKEIAVAVAPAGGRISVIEPGGRRTSSRIRPGDTVETISRRLALQMARKGARHGR